MNLKEKYQYLSVQAKATIWFTMCSFIQKGISFITVPIFTRLMSTEQYGIYTVYLSWLQILTILTSLYLFNGVYDNAMVKFEDYLHPEQYRNIAKLLHERRLDREQYIADFVTELTGYLKENIDQVEVFF